MELLRDLLELLVAADLWDLHKLKSEVGWHIADEQRLIDPDTYKMSECILSFIICAVLTGFSHGSCH